jgi:hypothetical protein
MPAIIFEKATSIQQKPRLRKKLSPENAKLKHAYRGFNQALRGVNYA